MKAIRIISLISLFVFGYSLTAQANTDTQADKIKQKLTETLSVNVLNVEPAPIKGLYQAITDRGIIYTTTDGSKLIHGTIYDLSNGMENLTEAALASPRREMIKKYQDKMIVFKAKHEKHVVTVFTDITCGYCRKLHNEMAEYNDLGITVRYLAFPRQGVPSDNASNMRSIWCAKDPRKAMNDAQNGKSIASANSSVCDPDINGQYQLGSTLGVNGTPAIVLENGSLIPGYQPPQNLLKLLDSKQ